MSLPNWVLRRSAMPQGARLTKWPVYISKPTHDWLRGPSAARGAKLWGWGPDDRKCAVCGQEVEIEYKEGVEILNGQWRGNEFFHHSCFHGMPGGFREAKTPIPRGNLDEGEYRFWIGYAQVMSSGAMCRCCHNSYYTEEDRKKHIADDKFAAGIWKERCAPRLIRAYNDLLRVSHLCLVCRDPRNGNSRWGVPLCSSSKCERVWKFDMNFRSVVLDAKLATQLEGKVIKTETNAISAKVREYCTYCHMFKDNAAHEIAHKNLMERGIGYNHGED